MILLHLAENNTKAIIYPVTAQYLSTMTPYVTDHLGSFMASW